MLQYIKKLISVSLLQKQSNAAEFNLTGLLQYLYEKTLQGSKTLLCELLVEIAIESSCCISRIFACLQLQKMHSNLLEKDKHTQDDMTQLGLAVNHEIAIGLVLILMNDDTTLIRQHGFNLAKCYQEVVGHVQEDEYVTLFKNNPKPTSKAKRSVGNHTPMKKETSSQLLKVLLKNQTEIVQDRSQLSIALSKVK